MIDVFRTSKAQFVSFNGLTPNLHITPEIILDEDAIRIRYFSENFPDIPLRAKITVWYP